VRRRGGGASGSSTGRFIFLVAMTVGLSLAGVVMVAAAHLSPPQERGGVGMEGTPSRLDLQA
jgi:hypothetical protein